jgi:GxxExxY protein
MDTDETLAEMESGLICKELTEQIIGAAMEVHNLLGSGFLEKVYENALAEELGRRGIRVEQQKTIKVYYKSTVVGDYVADILVEGQVILELKTVEQISSAHQAQMLNYLKATGLKVGLLINFNGPRLTWKRMVY